MSTRKRANQVSFFGAAVAAVGCREDQNGSPGTREAAVLVCVAAAHAHVRENRPKSAIALFASILASECASSLPDLELSCRITLARLCMKYPLLHQSAEVQLNMVWAVIGGQKDKELLDLKLMLLRMQADIQTERCTASNSAKDALAALRHTISRAWALCQEELERIDMRWYLYFAKKQYELHVMDSKDEAAHAEFQKAWSRLKALALARLRSKKASLLSPTASKRTTPPENLLPNQLEAIIQLQLAIHNLCQDNIEPAKKLVEAARLCIGRLPPDSSSPLNLMVVLVDVSVDTRLAKFVSAFKKIQALEPGKLKSALQSVCSRYMGTSRQLSAGNESELAVHALPTHPLLLNQIDQAFLFTNLENAFVSHLRSARLDLCYSCLALFYQEFSNNRHLLLPRSAARWRSTYMVLLSMFNQALGGDPSDILQKALSGYNSVEDRSMIQVHIDSSNERSLSAPISPDKASLDLTSLPHTLLHWSHLKSRLALQDTNALSHSLQVLDAANKEMGSMDIAIWSRAATAPQQHVSVNMAVKSGYIEGEYHARKAISNGATQGEQPIQDIAQLSRLSRLLTDYQAQVTHNCKKMKHGS